MYILYIQTGHIREQDIDARSYAIADGACVGQSEQEAVYAVVKEEAVAYSQRFNRALQHNHECVQHHIHRGKWQTRDTECLLGEEEPEAMQT